LTQRSRSFAAAGALLVVLVIGTGGGEARARTWQRLESAPVGLTAQGRMLWNLEALVRKTFGNRKVSVSGRANFSCSGTCMPLATFSRYVFTFDRPSNSSFHISSKSLRNATFGNYPIPVRIRGKPVACDRSEKRFLVRYLSAVSFTLGCLEPR
jgi:hypothetical protein